MSLINDALKRARETQRNDPPSGAPPLPPVESRARGGAGWILVVAAILFLAAAGLILGPALFGHKAPQTVTAKTPGIPAPPPAEAAPATNILPPPAKNTNPPTAAPVEQLPKLQGVIFNAANPLAIVDGHTVSVGDRVGDFQVKQILKNSVIIQQPDGSQKTLTIGK